MSQLPEVGSREIYIAVLPELAHILESAGRVLFVGVGNVLKSDDGAGVIISKGLVEKDPVMVLTVEVSIENYIGKIQTLNPDHIVLIDSMDLDSDPGTHRLIGLDQIQDITFNTHNISLSRLGDFFDCPVHVLGIQPKNVTFGENLTPPVRDAAENIIKQINQLNIQS